MPAVTPEDRDRIRALHGQGLGRNAIAKETGFSAATVTKVCTEEGLPFDRAATAVAVAARSMDLRARRAAIVARLYDRTERVLDRLEADTYQYKLVLSDSEGGSYAAEQHDINPPAADERALSGAIQTYLTAAAKLEALDADGGASEARAMLTKLGDYLGIESAS